MKEEIVEEVMFDGNLEEKKLKNKYGVCESCGERHVQWILKDAYVHRNTKGYRVCSSCLLMLVNCDLSAKNFKNILNNGHSDNEFLLHEDFYDEEGNALQPKV